MAVRPLALVFCLGLIINLLPATSGFQDLTFDSWTHLFFASHYQDSWFDTWEPRWFGGFSVTSYPPLVHQLIALVGFVIGNEVAFSLLTLGTMSLIPVAVYDLSARVLPEKCPYCCFPVSVSTLAVQG